MLSAQWDGEAVPPVACGVKRWAQSRTEAIGDWGGGRLDLVFTCSMATTTCLFTWSSPGKGGSYWGKGQGPAKGTGMLSAGGKRVWSSKKRYWGLVERLGVKPWQGKKLQWPSREDGCVCEPWEAFAGHCSDQLVSKAFCSVSVQYNRSWAVSGSLKGYGN